MSSHTRDIPFIGNRAGAELIKWYRDAVDGFRTGSRLTGNESIQIAIRPNIGFIAKRVPGTCGVAVGAGSDDKVATALRLSTGGFQIINIINSLLEETVHASILSANGDASHLGKVREDLGGIQSLSRGVAIAGESGVRPAARR